MSEQKDFVIEVIELYKQHPCLWQTTHTDYHNKNKRNAAMENLLQLFRTKDPSATKDVVIKKISSIRGSYRKELNKIKASQRSGAGSGEVHVPKLWYFELMSFLEDQDVPRRAQGISSIIDDMPFGNDESDVEANQSGINLSRGESSKRERPRSMADNVLEKISRRLDVVPPTQSRSEHNQFDAFGTNVAEQLRQLSPSVLPLCKRMIGEVIYLAEAGKLNASRIITEEENI